MIGYEQSGPGADSTGAHDNPAAHMIAPQRFRPRGRTGLSRRAGSSLRAEVRR